MTELSGLTAVVTGSSRGIGRVIALRLASAGADVVVHGNRNEGDAREVAGAIEVLGVASELLIADLATVDGRKYLVESAWAWKSGVDIWINNAGADVLTGSATGWSFAEKLARLWEVDVVATVNCSREIGQRMKSAGKGVIINTGWDQAWQGMEGDSGEMFSVVKGAIMAFTKSHAKSLAPEVRVNCVAPGWIKTAWGEDTSSYWHRRAIGESLRDRWGTPEDVAAAVCFLASPAADFINGQILPVNGGFRSSES